MRHDLERLLGEHDELDRLAGMLIDALSTSPCKISGILSLRHELSMRLDEHLSKEDGFLYENAICSSEAQFVSALDTFERDFAGLSDDWQTYLQQWPQDAIEQDIDNFRKATVALLDRLKARIAHENRLMYPLALQQGRITLRAC